MSCRLLPIVLLAAALPTVSLAEDYCAALNAAIIQVNEAKNQAIEASEAVSDLRFRLSQDRALYRNDVQDLAIPSDDVASSSNQLTTAFRDLTELRSDRCPNIPEGR